MGLPRRSRGTGQSKKVRSVPGVAFGIGVEQVIGADIVLIDAPLDQAHPKRFGVKALVLANLRRYRGQMVNAG